MERRARSPSRRLLGHREGSSGGLLAEHTIGFLLAGWSLAMGRMLIGMGLMKLGVFSAMRSRRFYLWMVVLGYGIGLPLMVFDASALIEHNFSSTYQMHGGLFYNYFGSLFVVLGHVGHGDADRAERRSDLAHQAAGGRGPNGAFQLPDPFDRLHDALLRIWIRPFRRHQPHGAGGDRADHLGLAASDQPDLAQAFPLRPGRVALAIAHVLEAAADAGVSALIPRRKRFVVTCPQALGGRAAGLFRSHSSLPDTS